MVCGDRGCKGDWDDGFGAHDLRRTSAKLCRQAGGDLEQIKFLLGHYLRPDDRTLSRVRAGDCCDRERQPGALTKHLNLGIAVRPIAA